MAKSPVPVGSSTPLTEGHSNVETVDQVLKPITAISIGIERQNSALGDRFGELSKCLDAFETKQPDSCVTLGTSARDSGLDLFSTRRCVLANLQPLLRPALIASFHNKKSSHHIFP